MIYVKVTKFLHLINNNSYEKNNIKKNIIL
jgi:hypothetical protein